MSEAQKNDQDNNNQSRRVNMNDVTRKITKGNKVAGIVVAIIMIVLGILFLVKPLMTDVIAMYIATAGFIIFGLFQVVAYFRTPSDIRNGWTLANGIIFIVLGVIMLMSNVASMLVTFTFLLGFLALFNGITQVTSYAAFKKSGAEGSGWVLASGIINIILGIFFLLSPFAAAWAIAYVLGIYLIVGGIALFAESASGHHAHKS